jgi:hypothetical protein
MTAPIVSLTTISSRIGAIGPTLQSILDGVVKPSRLTLWLCKDRGELGRGIQPDDVPQEVRKMPVEIRWCDNYGPATKLLPALMEWPRAHIVTADDDHLYHPGWLHRLVGASRRYPRSIVCYRGRLVANHSGECPPWRRWPIRRGRHIRPTHRLVPTACHGVLYPPGAFRSDVLDVDLLRRLSHGNDDLWFAATRQRPAAMIRRRGSIEERKVGHQGPRLWRQNGRGRNDQIIRALAEHFGEKVPWYPLFARECQT